VHAHYVKSGASIRDEAGVHLSSFQVQEPSGSWRGPLWPMEEQDLGHGALLSCPRPTLCLGLKKGGSAEPSRARASASFFFDCRPLRASSREPAADSLPCCCWIVKYKLFHCTSPDLSTPTPSLLIAPSNIQFCTTPQLSTCRLPHKTRRAHHWAQAADQCGTHVATSSGELIWRR